MHALPNPPDSPSIDARIDAIDWPTALAELDARGCVVLEGVLDVAFCRDIADHYADDSLYRSRVVMARHGFGLGEADGVVPDGTTVFDEVPAVTRLDPDLLTALRRAATDAKYRLCQIYENEAWHYELRPGAIDDGCPAMYADPTHDPRMQP